LDGKPLESLPEPAISSKRVVDAYNNIFLLPDNLSARDRWNKILEILSEGVNSDFIDISLRWSPYNVEVYPLLTEGGKATLAKINTLINNAYYDLLKSNEI
jgi:hypothetical protein